MPQRPKEEVRGAILAAAAAAFAEVGFERATLGDIVARAGTSIGNLYKYFSSKEEVFDAFLPRELVAELRDLFRARVEALGAADPLSVGETHPYHRASEELFRFTIEHRPQVVFLLARAAGSRYQSFAGDLVRVLVELALAHAGRHHPSFVATAARKRALLRIYRGFVASLASILEEERSERSLREAVGLLTTYHLSGLTAFLRTK
jgi:AcrR family transcriptional regulator